jgi:hypothetical protein
MVIESAFPLAILRLIGIHFFRTGYNKKYITQKPSLISKEVLDAHK